MGAQPADRVVIAFTPGDDRTADALRDDRYRTYLKRTRHGPLTVDDEWEEFVSDGCGRTHDVVLRVHELHGGRTLGEDTAIEFEPAEDVTG